MLELHLHHTGNQLAVALGEHRIAIPLAELVSSASNWQRIYDDAITYGRELFDQTFCEESMRTLITNIRANERLVLVTEDPLVASIPWEYLRDQHGKLLAARLNVVRSLPQERRRESFSLAGPLDIVAIPVSPVDEPQVLNVEGEWKRLVQAVTTITPPKTLTLKRVRPPTLTQMERALHSRVQPLCTLWAIVRARMGKACWLLKIRARERTWWMPSISPMLWMSRCSWSC
jgi:hypothetical protein